MVEINLEQTNLTLPIADFIIQAKAGGALPKIVDAIKALAI